MVAALQESADGVIQEATSTGLAQQTAASFVQGGIVRHAAQADGPPQLWEILIRGTDNDQGFTKERTMKRMGCCIGLMIAALLWANPVAAQGKGKGTGKKQVVAEPTFAMAANLQRDAAGDLLPAGAVGQLGGGRLRHLTPHLFFSADGNFLVSWSNDGPSIRFWDAATGQEVRRIVCTNQAPFRSVALAADNKSLAVVGSKGVTLVLDAETAAVRLRLQAHSENLNPAFKVAFSPDGKTLAATDTFTAITVWDTGTGREIARLAAKGTKGARGGGDLVFSPDGKYVTGLGGHKWEVTTGQHFPAPDSNTHDSWVRADSADGRLTAVFLGGLELRDRATGKVIHDFLGTQYYGASNRPSVLEFSPDGSVLAALSMSRALRLFDVASGKLLREFPKQLGSMPLSLAFSPDSKTLAFVRDRSKIVLWDVAGGKYRAEGTGHYDDFQALALSPDGRFLAVKPNGAALRLWDTTTCKPVAYDVEDVPDHGGFAFMPDGNTLASWGRNAMHFWEMPSGKHWRKPWRKEAPGPIAFSPNGKVMATGSNRSNEVILADTETGKVLHVLKEDGLEPFFRRVQFLVFAPQGHTLAVVYDSSIVLWNWRTGDKVMHTLKTDPVGAPCFLADGRTLATNGRYAGVVLLNVATGKPLHGAKQAGTSALALSPDGRFLLTAGQPNTVQLWEIATRAVRWQVPTHHGYIAQIAFAAKGGLAVTAHQDGTLLLWDLARMGQTAADVPGKLADKDLEKLWMDLASQSAVVAHQAVVELVARPAQALPLLKERLPTIYGDKLQELAQWLDGLDSKQFKVREQATKELEKAVKLAEPALRKLLAKKPGLEVTRRVEGVLAKLEAVEGQPPDAAFLQALRAVETLERLATPEARQLLEALAEMSPETWVSGEARAALRRLPLRKL
jgi:WD40 repeat protein